MGPKYVGVLINLFLISECFKVYFSTKSWFLKYKSGLLHGHNIKKKYIYHTFFFIWWCYSVFLVNITAEGNDT